MNAEHEVAAYYAHGSLLKTILKALRSQGVDVDNLRADDLVAFEEFHIGGRPATAYMAHLLQPPDGAELLDVGSGIGGAARYFALEHGCRVVGVDLTDEFCAVATDLSVRLGIGEQTRFVHGSALDLPLEDASFDGAYMLHVGMNIDDKARLFSEVGRVLRPGARFAVYDILDAGGGQVYFPAPWAQDESTSFLVDAAELSSIMEECGFEIVVREDRGDAGRAFFREQAAAREAGEAPVVGVPILMGESGPERLRNAARSLSEDRISPWLVIGQKKV